MKHTNDVNDVEEGQNVNTLSEIEEYYKAREHKVPPERPPARSANPPEPSWTQAASLTHARRSKQIPGGNRRACGRGSASC